MNRTALAHPTIVFGGDTDVVELMEKLALYPENSKHDVFINGVLSCKDNWKAQEVFIPGNLKVNGLCNNKIILRIAGNLECNGRIDVGILKVEGNVFGEDLIQVYDFTAKGEVHCDGPLDGQFVIIGKDLSITKEIYPAINAKSLRVSGNIYCNGSMEGDNLWASGDVYCREYMDIPNRQIKGETYIEKTELRIAK